MAKLRFALGNVTVKMLQKKQMTTYPKRNAVSRLKVLFDTFSFKKKYRKQFPYPFCKNSVSSSRLKMPPMDRRGTSWEATRSMASTCSPSTITSSRPSF